MSRLNLTSRQRRRLRRQLAETHDARLFQRTLAVLEFDFGRSAADIARMLGVTRQSVYNWIEAYTLDHDPSSLEDEEGRGRDPLLDEDQEHLLEALLAVPPQELGYPHTSWTVPLLREALEIATEQRVSEDTLGRALGRLDYVWKRPRYDLDPDPEREKKNAAFVGKSGPCRGAASCWLRTRPTCCCSHRCVALGRSAAKPPRSGSAAAMPGV